MYLFYLQETRLQDKDTLDHTTIRHVDCYLSLPNFHSGDRCFSCRDHLRALSTRNSKKKSNNQYLLRVMLITDTFQLQRSTKGSVNYTTNIAAQAKESKD